MKKSVLTIALLLGACASEPRTVAFVDPLNGQTEPMSETELIGWKAYQFKSAPDAFISVAQAGAPVFSILGRAGSDRDISVHSKNGGEDIIMHDAGGDGTIEDIELYSEGVLYKLKKVNKEWVLSSYRK